MDFSKYTTQELESIASKFDDLKRELEIRHNDDHKIFIEHRDIDDQIETAKAAICLVGDWHRIAISQQSQHNEPDDWG